MGVLSWGVPVTRNFQRPLAAKLCDKPPKVFEVQECARDPLSACQVWWGSHFTRRHGVTWSLFVCLSVCSSRFWMSEIVRLISPWRRCSIETILIPLDRGRFVVVHPCSTFSDCCQLATPLNAEVQKNSKNCGFSLTESDRINRTRWNLARKRIPCICYSTPHLALTGKRESVQEPPNLPKIVVFGHQKPTQWTN